MTPTEQKKAPVSQKPITHKRLYNIALFYLSRYDASLEKVRAVLNRRVQKSIQAGEPINPETNQWIEDILIRLSELGYLSDERYVQNQIRRLSEQGKSNQFILMKLKSAGISEDMIRPLLETLSSSEQERADRFVKKKKLGCFRPQNQQEAFHMKDMATLGRAGFSYEIARKALSQETEE